MVVGIVVLSLFVFLSLFVIHSWKKKKKKRKKWANQKVGKGHLIRLPCMWKPSLKSSFWESVEGNINIKRKKRQSANLKHDAISRGYSCCCVNSEVVGMFSQQKEKFWFDRVVTQWITPMPVKPTQRSPSITSRFLKSACESLGRAVPNINENIWYTATGTCFLFLAICHSSWSANLKLFDKRGGAKANCTVCQKLSFILIKKSKETGLPCYWFGLLAIGPK